MANLVLRYLMLTRTKMRQDRVALSPDRTSKLTVFEEPHAVISPPKDREASVKKWLEGKYEPEIRSMLTLEWKYESSHCIVRDPNNDICAIFRWEAGKYPIVLDFGLTQFLVATTNSRLPFSCAIGSRTTDKSGMLGKLASAREEVGGVMCTN